MGWAGAASLSENERVGGHDMKNRSLFAVERMSRKLPFHGERHVPALERLGLHRTCGRPDPL